VLAILTVITLGFGRRAMLDRRAATYSLDHAKAMYMARGAVERGIVELRNKSIMDTLSQVPGRTSYRQPWAKPGDLLAEEGFFADAKDEELGEDICEYRIRDECSRVNVNAAEEDLLDNIGGISAQQIRKINSRRRGDPGARLPPQPFQTVEELRSLDGVSDKDWFGTDRTPGLRDLMTVWGDGKVNINTASAEVLECIPDVSRRVIRSIIEFRAGPDGELCTSDDEDYKSLEEMREKLGLGDDSLADLRPYCKVNSGFFTIVGTATRRRGKVRATCVAAYQMGGREKDPRELKVHRGAIIKWREEFVDP